MTLLALLHRWAGGLVGALLVVIALSGTVLVWEEQWIDLPGADEPPPTEARALAAAVTRAAELGELSRVTFASEDFGLHQAIYADGSGAYLDRNAAVVDHWGDLWGRTELWLFDLHHYLFVGETGETVAGVLGLLLIFFTISGAILWWRTRKTFRLRVLPPRLTRSAIVRHHRDLGIVSAPLLLLAGLTGSLMIFGPAADLLLSPWGVASPPTPEIEVAAEPPAEPSWEAMIRSSLAAFPDASPRRLQMPREGDKPYVMRLKQDFEWTPNGRTYVYLDPTTAQVLARVDPSAGDTAQAIQEKFYPLHAGKVGGLAWKAMLTLGGISLILLGFFAVWSFWFPRPARRPSASPTRVPLA